jgi:hypothetical protein
MTSQVDEKSVLLKFDYQKWTDALYGKVFLE